MSHDSMDFLRSEIVPPVFTDIPEADKIPVYLFGGPYAGWLGEVPFQASRERCLARAFEITVTLHDEDGPPDNETIWRGFYVLDGCHNLDDKCAVPLYRWNEESME